ncbi:hypothetical protein [Kitasatospora phosalacinea]|uniref:hypothetical protein n=1 Tax=Kitasatospora phosalacinea TaxID=2065 RepID=UPI000B06E8D1|nr:hypothetical protein [Kitasatospora phosalacinea]
MGTVGVVYAVVGLLGAWLLRRLPVRGRTEGLSAAGVAAVRGGGRAALAVVAVELWRAGAIEVGRSGRLRRLVHSAPGRGTAPLHRALRSALGRELSLADAAVAPAVRRARAELLAEMAGRGLRCGRARLAASALLALASAGTAVALAVRGDLATGLPLAALALAVPFTPARTPAGHRLLRDLRRLHPLPEADAAANAAADTDPAEAGLLTALHGRRALRLLAPGFAAPAGLLGRRTARETVARSEGDAFGFGTVPTSVLSSGDSHGA